MIMNVFLKDVDGHTPPAPKLATPGSCAIDLCCVLPEVSIEPQETVFIDTGIVTRVPRDYALLILSRSSVATKRNLIIPNSPGLVDRDYCGPNDTIKVALRNIGTETQVINAGDRIAQMMLISCEEQRIGIVKTYEELIPGLMPVKNRGGFGSTGQ
jgi:dUTP pyrophosphatase